MKGKVALENSLEKCILMQRQTFSFDIRFFQIHKRLYMSLLEVAIPFIAETCEKM